MPTNDEQLLLQLMGDDLAQYCMGQKQDFEIAPHHQSIIDHLEQVEAGVIDRLMVFAPPQHGKSQLVSKLFPAWYLGRHPDRNIISAAYGQKFVLGFGRAVRNYVNSPLHQAAFPDCRIASDSAAADAFALGAGGEYFAVGRGSPTTGRGANIIIIDDPLKDRREASSGAIRDQLKEWYTDVVYTRQRGQCAIVIINTRWHVDDLSGWLLREHADEGWTVLNFPAIAEKDDGLGREVGEALWPSRYPIGKLERIRARIPANSWVSLYQQRPTLGSGYLFKRDWLQYYETRHPHAFRSMNRVILVDPANSQKKGSDYTFMWVVGASEDQSYYVLDMIRDRLSLTERIEKLFELHKKWGQPELVAYEQYGMQADIAAIKDKMDRDHYQFHIQPMMGTIAKADRIEMLEPMFRQGKIRLPHELDYTDREGQRRDLVRDFVEEEYANYVAGGGGVKHDDGLDSLSRLVEVNLEFPTSSIISANYRLFERSRELRKRGTSAWAS